MTMPGLKPSRSAGPAAAVEPTFVPLLSFGVLGTPAPPEWGIVQRVSPVDARFPVLDRVTPPLAPAPLGTIYGVLTGKFERFWERDTMRE
jgi:hypothetical protein